MSDVITYPLMRELFAFKKIEVVVAIDRDNVTADFPSKQI